MSDKFVCPNCDTKMELVPFTERETKIVNGHLIETGRVRLNYDYLLCPICGHTEAIDDSFAEPWYTV